MLLTSSESSRDFSKRFDGDREDRQQELTTERTIEGHFEFRN